MGLRVQVAADLYGRKENVVIDFGDSRRALTLAAVVSIIERVYDAEARAMASRSPDPDGSAPPPFAVQYMQSFTEEDGWEDVVSAQQLYDGLQLFVFQPRNSVHSDNQDLIPVAKEPVLPPPYDATVAPGAPAPVAGVQQHMPAPPTTPSASVELPLRATASAAAEVPASAILAAFSKLEGAGTGTVTLARVRAGFAKLGVELSPGTVASLFGMSAPRRPQGPDPRTVDVDDWFSLAAAHPKIVRSLIQYDDLPAQQAAAAESAASAAAAAAAAAAAQHETPSTPRRGSEAAVARAQSQAASRLATGRSAVAQSGAAEQKAEEAAAKRARLREEREKKAETGARGGAWRPAGVQRTQSPGVGTRCVLECRWGARTRTHTHTHTQKASAPQHNPLRRSIARTPSKSGIPFDRTLLRGAFEGRHQPPPQPLPWQRRRRRRRGHHPPRRRRSLAQPSVS